jgi:hypothetical protein
MLPLVRVPTRMLHAMPVLGFEANPSTAAEHFLRELVSASGWKAESHGTALWNQQTGGRLGAIAPVPTPTPLLP